MIRANLEVMLHGGSGIKLVGSTVYYQSVPQCKATVSLNTLFNSASFNFS